MATYSKKDLERAKFVKEQELYVKEGYKKAVFLNRTFADYQNHLYAYLIDLSICLLPVYVWGVEFILILSGVISPAYFDLLFYIMYALLFLTSCILLPLYTASKGGYSWGGRLMGLRLVRADKKPATVMRLVVRELLGIGAPMMLFGYFFSIWGIFLWWGVNGLCVLASPHQQTIFDWLLNLALVYTPRYSMRVIGSKAKGQKPAPSNTEENENSSAASPSEKPAAQAAKPQPKGQVKPALSEEEKQIWPIDLHIRSSFSDDADGEVEDIFCQAKEQNMEVISITDHNNARANAQAVRFAKMYGIRYIPGVEIDCELDGERVRILGYYIDWTASFFDQIERLSLKREKDASIDRIRAFEAATGMKVDTESLLSNSRFKLLRPQELTDLVFDTPEARKLPAVSSYLISARSEKEAREAFLRDYFGPGGPCHITYKYPNALKVIEGIHQAGGLAVLSGWHISRISSEVLLRLMDGGLDGFEVFAPNNTEAEKRFLLKLAGEEKSLITAGSDYHGTRRPDRKMGVTTMTGKARSVVELFTQAALEPPRPSSSRRAG